MTTDELAAEGRHKHPPICCCLGGPYHEPHRPDHPDRICPGCPDHGTLAISANPVECPQCHQAAGRPHTDYCTLDPERVFAGMGHARCNRCGATEPQSPCRYSDVPCHARMEGTLLRTPAEWAELEDCLILDPDGWRGRNGRDFNDPITEAEYQRRRAVSTVSFGRTHPPIGQVSQPATRTSQPSTHARAVTCGFRSLANTDLVCTYPPHAVDQVHSWQDGGDPRGWRNAIDPNKDR